jgi:uncharacterized phiE125 gp8 family phage protein
VAIPDSVFTLEAAKAHLRVLHDDEDALIGAMLDAAVERCEQWTGKAWTARSISMVVPRLCASWSPSLLLPLAPMKTLTSFKYQQIGTPAPVAVPADTYRFRTLPNGQVALQLDSVPPDLDTTKGDSMWLVYEAAPTGSVPAGVIAAAHLYLGDLYASREANVVGTIIAVNEAAISLLAPHRVTLGM